MLKLSVCAALAAIGLAGSFVGAAQADPIRLGQSVIGQSVIVDPMPPVEAISLVRSLDFDPITRPVLRGRFYVLRALDEGGAEVRVRIDALAGRVVAVHPVRRSVRRVVIQQTPLRRMRRAPWGRDYPLEWGEVPPPPGAVRRHADLAPSARQELGTGPSVIYAPRSRVEPPSHAARAKVPVVHPPLPKARPNKLAAVNNTAPPAAKPAPEPAPAEPNPVAKPAGTTAPKVPDVSPPF